MTFPAIGTPFHAVILTPPTIEFARGEVVKGKILNAAGDFRIRSFCAKPTDPCTELGTAYMEFIKIIPDIKTVIVPLVETPWTKHGKTLADKRWFHPKAKI